MTTLTDREAQTETTHRDAQTLTPYEVIMTDVKAWAAALEKHVDRGVIEDNEVWFSITAHPATINEVDGKPVPGGHRENPYFASRHVEAAYTARGKMHKLSVYCGVSWAREAPTEAAQRIHAALVQACAENIQAAVRAVSVALSRHKTLEVVSGAALHLHNMQDGPWVAGPGTSIEMPPSETCGVCGVELHFAGGEWKDERNRSEAMTPNGLDYKRRPKYRLDHVHRPADGAL